jgi:hypothetical protein
MLNFQAKTDGSSNMSAHSQEGKSGGLVSKVRRFYSLCLLLLYAYFQAKMDGSSTVGAHSQEGKSVGQVSKVGRFYSL